MLDRNVAEMYYEYAKELDQYYEKRKNEIELIDVVGVGDKDTIKIQLMEYFFPWRKLEKGQEIDQLYFEFNHSLKMLSKYIGVIDRMGDNLYNITNLELKKASKNGAHIKDISSLFVDAKLEDYKKNNLISEDTKEFAEIYFKFKSLETSLVKWFKILSEKENYEVKLKSEGMYI